ncbi:MAG: phosphoadenylyl-sulfate reductase [Burkholderiales bacterium]|nr:phosphoadenylyl-sulfate reductase [Burkholderiales bacterium]MDE2396171.1 phosphoadenylyl-sulfate reductase [Burkholderiales bacterium]MDE2455140.1 phosphoadenylyl-sulfate reductase [Burkholderiales bacterium]
MRSAIELHARKTRGYEARVAHAVALLREAAEDHAGTIVQSSSLGVEGMVLTDMIARHRLGIPVATLDTGRLHAETRALIPAIHQRYGIEVQVYAPRQEAVLHFVRRHGEDAMFESVELRRACCDTRKLEPMKRLLEGRSAWVTGLRREQSEARSTVPFFEIDAEGREKFYPLADWSEADIWHYVSVNEVPYNELHDRFFPSIGCAPCTRAVSLGEDPRSGRWWWEGEGVRECGLHLRPEKAVA